MVRRCRLWPSPSKPADLFCPGNSRLRLNRQQSIIAELRIILFAVLATATLTIPGLVPPVSAQSAVPSATSKSRGPQSGIATQRRAAHNVSTAVGAKKHRTVAPDSVIYENGPISGNVDAWEINFGFVTSDTFTIPGGSPPINTFTFGAWLFPGDVLQSVDVSISSDEFGGTTFFSGTVNLTPSGCISNGFGTNICTETGTFPGIALNAGMYWINVQNAVVNNGDPVYWDENSGVGCHSQGCPSAASESSVGTIPSESFTLSSTGDSTTITLSAPSSATPGQAIPLAATVTDQNNQPVQIGTVTFLSGVQVLGIVQVNQILNAATTLLARFAPGTYSLTAQYNGNQSYPGSQSTVQSLTVNGTEPTASTLSATPNGTRYNFDLSVFGFGTTALSGTATLTNQTQGGSFLGTIPIAGPGTSSFQIQQQYPSGAGPTGIAAADFDGDGFADLVATNPSNNTVSQLHGVGDGTFVLRNSTSTGSQPTGVVAWDFNGDGKMDFAVTDLGDHGIRTWLGLGGGVFQQIPFQLDLSSSPYALVEGDFNNDGKADLAITDVQNNQVWVLLGQGNGHFASQGTYATGIDPRGIAVGDFNHDGIADLAVTNFQGQSVSILFGNGNGSFRPQIVIQVGLNPLGIAVADFNQDGNLDLAVANLGSNNVGVLLGNADGSFQPEQTYPTISLPYSIVIADFNGDRNADIAVTNSDDPPNNVVRVLLGNGDGSFQQQPPYLVGANAFGLALSDFNGDGTPDLASADNTDNKVSILLDGTLSLGQLNNVQVCGIGDQDILSSFTPDGVFYAGGTSNIESVIGCGLFSTTTTLASSANPSTYLQPVNFTATVTVPPGSGTPTGSVTFTVDGNPIAGCIGIQLQNGIVPPCQTTSLPVGSHCIAASYSGDGNFGSSQSPCLSQIVNQAASAVNVTSTPNPSQLNQSVVIAAQVNGLPGVVPTGTVTFTDRFNGVQTTLCAGVSLNQQGKATCSTAALACGTHSDLVASYGGDQNYLPSNGTASPPQVVAGCGTFLVLPISPASVEVTQTFNNNNEPFHAQAITAIVQPLSGYSATVRLSCSVSPPLTGGSCTVSVPSGLVGPRSLATQLTIGVGGNTPTGNYTVTVQAQDDSGLVESATMGLTVDEKTMPLTMVTGGAGPPVPIVFGPGPGTLSEFSCSLVTGTGIAGTEDFGSIGGVCSFDKTSTNLPDPVVVTITGCTIARLGTGTRIYASLWFGLPAVVLLGSFRPRLRAGKKLLQWLALFLVVSILLFGMGCGGGVGPTTPSGSYLVLVQGTGADGTVYSAVIPVTVTPLGQ